MMSSSVVEEEQLDSRGDESPDVCPPTSSVVTLNSVTIQDGVDTHIGNKNINITNADNITLDVSELPDVQVIKEIQQSLENCQSGSSQSKTNFHLNISVYWLGCLVILIPVIIFIMLQNLKTVEHYSASTYLNDSSYCDGICVVEREEWGWVPALDNSTCNLVNATSLRATILLQTCTNIDQCSDTVRGFQNILNYDTLLPSNISTRYNFVIGGDERIYVGRGWDCGWNTFFNTAIVFNNFSYTLSEKQIYLFLLLINVGLRCGHINENFETLVKCNYNCHLYDGLEKALKLAERKIFSVKNYEGFTEDSEVISNGLCYNSTYIL